MSGMARRPTPLRPDPAPAPRRARPATTRHAPPTARRPAAPAFVDRGDAWCVIGAGPHGLSALKALLEAGFDADCYERESDVGGNWNIDARNSRIYRSIHLISSRPFTQYPDFPMPDSFADYPCHRQVKGYFGRYADHFGLREHITFDNDVLRVEPVDDGARWDVTVRDRVRRGATRRYDGVVVANGHNWSPEDADYEGLDAFARRGPALRGLQGLRRAARQAGAHRRRRQHRLRPRGRGRAERRAHVPLDPARLLLQPQVRAGRPSDQVNDSLLALRIPLAVRRLMFKTTLRTRSGPHKFGLQKPDHEFCETHPVVNSSSSTTSATATSRPSRRSTRFDADGVVFTDGPGARSTWWSSAPATSRRFPFLDDERSTRRRPPAPVPADVHAAARQPLRRGLNQPDSGHWPCRTGRGSDRRVAEALRADPPRRGFRALAAETDRRFTGGAHYKDSTRHYFEIAHQDFLGGVEDAIHQLEVARMSGGAVRRRPVRASRAMRPWDWAFRRAPVSHREVLSALPAEPTGEPAAALRPRPRPRRVVLRRALAPGRRRAGFPSYAVSLRGHGGRRGAAPAAHDDARLRPRRAAGHRRAARAAGAGRPLDGRARRAARAERYPARPRAARARPAARRWAPPRDRQGPALARAARGGRPDPADGPRHALRGARPRRARAFAGRTGPSRRSPSGSCSCARTVGPIRTPVIVVGTPEDRLVPPADVERTADAYGVEPLFSRASATT